MNCEVSHIAQWFELLARAKNFKLTILFDASYFFLYKQIDQGKPPLLGKYLTLADLRAGISDYVAGERVAGRMRT